MADPTSHYQQMKTSLVRLYSTTEITSLYDSFEDENSAYLCLQHYKDGSLRELALSEVGLLPMPEEETQKLMIMLSEIIYKLHKRRVLHGNINLNTILVKKSSRGARIKLSDFSRARLLKRASLNPKLNGNKAPTLARKNKSVEQNILMQLSEDVFAVGLIGYMLMTGLPETEHQVEPETIDFSDPIWATRSEACVDLLQSMLHPDAE